MEKFYLSMLFYFIAYFVVTDIGVLHTIFNIKVLKMKSMKETWKDLGSVPDNEPLKSLFVRLGYSREDVAKLLKEF